MSLPKENNISSESDLGADAGGSRGVTLAVAPSAAPVPLHGELLGPELSAAMRNGNVTLHYFDVGRVVDTFSIIAEKLLTRSVPEQVSEYLTTDEAARYLRRSSSWLLKQHDIPYLKGVPNTYSRKDLDAWVERNKFHPEV